MMFTDRPGTEYEPDKLPLLNDPGRPFDECVPIDEAVPGTLSQFSVRYRVARVIVAESGIVSRICVPYPYAAARDVEISAAVPE
jgi:hypothetical protein